MAYKNKADKAAAARRWRQTPTGKLSGLKYNRTPKAKANRRSRYLVQREILMALKQSPCMDCGGTFPAECMDFDHRPGTEKRSEVGSMVCNSVPSLMAEIAKCDLVCSNCHRIRTFSRVRDGH